MKQYARAILAVLWILLIMCVLHEPAKAASVPEVPDYTNFKSVSIYKIEKITVDGGQVLYFNAGININSVDMTIYKLESMKVQPIYLKINSDGGNVLAAGKLIDYIKNSGKRIITVCDNYCGSMAFHVFEVGERRLMTSKAMLMSHPSFQTSGDNVITENSYEKTKAFRLYKDRLDLDIAVRAKIPYEKYKLMTLSNIWAEAPEALGMNLADGVVVLEITGPSLYVIKGSSNISKEEVALQQEIKRRNKK